MDMRQYYSPKAEELSDDMKNNIIKILNRRYKELIKNKLRPDLVSAEIIAQQERDLKTIINFLDAIGLHACYDIPGYRGTYCFPSYQDCEDWNDWLWQCKEYE